MDVIEIVLGDNIYRVQQMYLKYSSFFEGNMSWNNNQSIRSIQLEVDNDLNNKLLENYLEFLLGNNFTMEEEDEEFFEYMGHPNLYEYPIHIWKMKLKSRWIRDNFYKYKLDQRDDGLYGLTEIPIKNNLKLTSTQTGYYVPIPEGLTIAGGAALFMSGYTDSFTDIDLFPLDKDVAIKFMQEAGLPIVTSATVSGHMDININTNIFGIDTYINPLMVQVIKREYYSPAEIVYGFDIDCSGFVAVYKGEKAKLYATEMALSSLDTKEIWFDPEFTEERYYWRLMKYIRRGFTLKLPLISDLYINNDEVEEPVMMRVLRNDFKNSALGMFYNVLPMGYRVGAIYTSNIPPNTPKDIGSLLILMAFYHFSPSTLNVYSYNYACEVLGAEKLPAMEGDPYADDIVYSDEIQQYKEEIRDWVVKEKVMLRNRYDSDLNIDSPEELMNIYTSSPFYQDG
jgi:hypothetical protein